MKKNILTAIACLFSGYLFSQDNSSNNANNQFNSFVSEKTSISVPTKPELAIYPNPARNKISLQVKGFDPGMATVRIVDTKGKLMREDNRLLVNGNEEVIMFLSFPPGIYFISISKKDKIAKKKIVLL